jgi:coenzyme F420-reducing hydrogenase delta subunit
VEYLKQLLAEIGLEPGRVQMFNLSAAMAGSFVEAVKQMVEQVTAVGSNPLRVSSVRQPDQNQEDRI